MSRGSWPIPCACEGGLRKARLMREWGGLGLGRRAYQWSGRGGGGGIGVERAANPSFRGDWESSGFVDLGT